MSTIVDRLLDVDREAHRILEEARQYQEKTQRESGAQRQKLEQEYGEKAENYIRSVREMSEAEVEESIGEIRQRYALLAEEMEGRWESSHQKWEDELFLRCLGR